MKTSLRNGLIRVARGASFSLGLTLLVSAVAGSARADFSVPEVDPGSLTSALTILTGGILTLTGRVRRGK